MKTTIWGAALALVLLALVVVGVGCGGGDGTSGGTGGGQSGEEATATTGSEAEEGGSEGGGSEQSGGGSQGSIATSPLDKAEYRKRILATCKRISEEEIENATAYANQHPDESLQQRAVGAFESVYLAANEERVSEMREVGAPEGEEAQIEKLVVTLEEAVEAGKNGGPESAAYTKKSLEARALAEKYGIDDCVI